MSLVYWLARTGCALTRWIPQTARRATGRAIGAGSYLCWRSKRIVTQHNLAQVTNRSVRDPHVRYLAFASWCNYGRYAADFLNFSNLDCSVIEQNIRDMTQGAPSWQDHLEHALESGRGVILVTAHFGNWDIAGALIARYVPLSAVVETFSDEQLNRLVQNQRKEKGINIIPMESSPRRILRILQQNQLVALVVDRPLSSNQGTPVSLFGSITYVPRGPAVLALKSGAAILPGYVWYGLHNELYLRAFPPIFPQEGSSQDQTGEVTRLTQRICDTLEEMVREWPTQWYMFRQFWPGQSS
jgi:lauroyl/myristoyl acyltransferase